MSRVLVVEDDPAVAALLEAVLAADDHEVVVVDDGLPALLQVATGGFDCVVLDIMMPDVDGHRVLAQLREEHDGALPVPVVVVTGSEIAAERVRDVLDPADVLTKPFEPGDLLARVRHHTGG